MSPSLGAYETRVIVASGPIRQPVGGGVSWRAIVVGVDASPPSGDAAAMGVQIAQAAAVPCTLVHGCRLTFDPPATAEYLGDVERLVEHHLEAARRRLTSELRDRVPPDVLAALDVRLGPPAGVVAEVAHERQADLIVVGGKHHTALARWTGGSTALHLVRVTDVPLLVVGPRPGPLRRVLLAVDLSYALEPTFEFAQRFARLCRAEMRALYVAEPLPAIAELPVALSDEAFFAEAEDRFHRAMEPLRARTSFEAVVRRGSASQTVAQEATTWNADVVVVGSHGKGWMHRLLVGSVTEQLLNALPTSLLVVPVPAPAGGRRHRTPAPGARAAVEHRRETVP